METRLSGHGVYRTEYHVVWIPKYRRRIQNPGVANYLRKLFLKVLRRMPGCEVVQQNVQVLHKVYWKEAVVWSPGYFVSTVGVDEDTIIAYVKWQQREDSGQAKLELF